jgi:hypothetical protein
MMHEGTIREVMETWPLQIVLESPQGLVSVTLTEDVVVRRSDGSVGGVELLRPGRHARVDPREVIVSVP